MVKRDTETQLTDTLAHLDDAHSTFMSLIDAGEVSAVLTTVASVLGSIPELREGCHDPLFWQNVIVNLNTLADELASEPIFEAMAEHGFTYSPDEIDLDELGE